MDAALGPPEKMAERADELTPMMRQYYELCRAYDDSLVLFQVGDFYEAFCGAAERVARLCEITLTKREDSTGQYAMAGVPIDNAESYVETLLDAGYRVAIADQVEDPDAVSGVVDRAVTRIITPGTLTEDELLDSPDNNYVAALTADGRRYGLALLDVSTGDFYATSADAVDAVADEVGRFAPAEAIVGPGVDVDEDRVFEAAAMVTPYDESVFAFEDAADRVRTYFGDPDALLADDLEVRACGALLAYAEYTRGGGAGTSDEIADDDGGQLTYLTHLTRYDPREYMLLDAVALDSLELFERRAVRGHEGRTLVDTVDETACALGRRRLGDWLRRPLLDADRIERRHEAVAELVEALQRRERLHALLADVYDLERLISRVSRGRANARDLRSLAATLAVVPDVREQLADADSALLADLHEGLDPLTDVREEIEAAICPDPPQEVTEGDVIREGYDDDLDALRETERSGKRWIDDLEINERERTGIDSLKVGHNSVHGYYIEVTDPNLDSVPDDYERRQTLKNSERFVTPELREREEEIVRAETAADDLEYDLFCEVRAAIAAEAERVQALADRLATLDALVAFGEVAATHDYCRPSVGGDAIDVTAGRHPVVERAEASFVPNDACLTPDSFFTILTGPNMSGKSTYMRQIALICVLAQAGSFVPAREANLPIVDRVFTRVGASDDIAGGRSTFMIEMTELADILQGATSDSLILLDEVGRGTSTADGLAIARAVTEHVHDEIGAYTLFATHHHELTAVADELPGVRNRHFETRHDGDGVVFEHSVAPGAAAASYGIEVAALAGVPDSVVERSRTVLASEDERSESSETRAGAERHAGGEDERSESSDAENGAVAQASAPASEPPSASADGHAVVEAATGDESGPDADPLRERLAQLDVATMTPIEAMNALARLQDDIAD
ncbi:MULTISPECIES: DNA mismatch repair protein MutS [Halomicrobium]|uniref:DNA mismatch repair protein MutS n=2 Tax=Halomicrobium mukohataei TaxID=57705 RepID=C7NXQ7_HALMD|nr:MULTISPECIES: DNA mismatch repair protein MutS [Halomicrobium]ACV46495.1 DNA mismatch repair protein MutS [Halomicrobium mukohataei DSM 12286]QCD65041.1 DNA mismatch repair protein MutS [Halomicrobium mukohataei]QFR19847.1 DNA mismatch repair protein MutS [Halomicrobium sp. ZPS1]